MPYKTQQGEIKGDLVVLATYFGRKEGQGLSEFNNEVKALTDADKQELVVGAAKELGWEAV